MGARFITQRGCYGNLFVLARAALKASFAIVVTDSAVMHATVASLSALVSSAIASEKKAPARIWDRIAHWVGGAQPFPRRVAAVEVKAA